jgi:hypothetical protein
MSESVLWEFTADRLDLAQVSEAFMQSCVNNIQAELDSLKAQMA